jgi:hypothetical protein
MPPKCAPDVDRRIFDNNMAHPLGNIIAFPAPNDFRTLPVWKPNRELLQSIIAMLSRVRTTH